MPRGLLKNQAQAQAVYMRYLIERASNNAKSVRNPAFDPQGRLLLDVTLSNAEIITLVGEINQQGGTNYPTNKAGLEQAMGRKISNTTTVSLDISKNLDLFDTPLLEQFKSQVTQALIDNGSKKDAPKIMAALDKVPKGSIIALQQEFHFHLALATRVYQKLDKFEHVQEKHMQNAFQATMTEVNKLVMKTYAKALKNAMQPDGSIDTVALNKSLDKARKAIMQDAHNILMKQIVIHTKVILTKEDFEVSLKHLAEETTATPNDILHTDAASGLSTIIEGSEQTAHNRVAGTEFAHRQLTTHSLNKDNSITATNLPRIQIRTPSPVLKKGLDDDNAYAKDVAIKLNAVKEEYHLAEHLVSQGRKPAAFIYNSYTALNDRLGDINGNLQTQSADHILRGAHKYNAAQLKSDTPVFCLVQNISVNGFGDELRYDSGNELVEESTLMSEMALLHTLYDSKNISDADREAIGDVFDTYDKFLRNNTDEPYFSQTRGGIAVKHQIQELKNGWQAARPKVGTVEDTVDYAKMALQQLMANNLHGTHEFAKLTQTLSVFLEEATLGGCKSGNERAQTINGRVAILDSLVNSGKPLSPEKFKIFALLKQVAEGQNVPEASRALKQTIDHEYNRTGLQAAASIVSLVDQGASAKVEAKPDSPLFISRNFAEESVNSMDNLQQTKAGKMQAHKGLSGLMESAWMGNPKSWWARMTSSPLGTVGALIALVTVIPAVAVLVYSVVNNAAKLDAVTASNNTLLTAANQASTSSTPSSTSTITRTMPREIPSSSVANQTAATNSKTAAADVTPYSTMTPQELKAALASHRDSLKEKAVDAPQNTEEYKSGMN